MKDNVAPHLWVPMSEAVRMIARFDGELLRSPGDIPPKAEVKLIEALRTGRVTGMGEHFTTARVEKISPRTWQKHDQVARHCELREHGTRLPRYTSIEIDEADITREFAKAREADQPIATTEGVKGAPKNKGGRPPAVDWDGTVKTEMVRLMDYYRDFGPDVPEWNKQARLEDRLEEFCNKKFSKRPATSTIRDHITPWLAEWRAGKQRPPET
jgi:hypothetical protein